MNPMIRPRVQRGARPDGRLTAILLLGMLLLAPLAGEEKKPSKVVNINTAPAEELAQLPGVGQEIARRIIRHRARSGKFRTVDELLVVRGISAKKLEKLRPYVTVEEPATGQTEKKQR